MFHIKNSHLYPIIDKKINQSLFKTEKSNIFNIYKFSIVYENVKFFKDKSHAELINDLI